MKMHVEIDCSPEEARRFLGLPDLAKANQAYVEGVASAMKGATTFDQLETMARQMAPMGQMGLKLFQQLMQMGQQPAGPTGKGGTDKGGSGDGDSSG